jgi:hypothetical protein
MMFYMTLMYLDAGTGSLILQAVLGGAGGLLVLLRTRFGRKTADVAPESLGETLED